MKFKKLLAGVLVAAALIMAGTASSYAASAVKHPIEIFRAGAAQAKGAIVVAQNRKKRRRRRKAGAAIAGAAVSFQLHVVHALRSNVFW